MTPFMRRTVCSLVLSLSYACGLSTAQAALISTEQAAAAQQPSALDARAQVNAALQRADLRTALTARGVDVAHVQARVDALTDDEARALAQQIDQAPAGAEDILGTLVFIFVLLLVTDILGLTKVFPFTRSIRH